MSPSLQTCPLPVIEHIVELLDLADIRNLRLSCATLATKACSRFFKSLYVDLTTNSLLAFAEATRTDSPLSKVNTLNIVGIIHELDDSTLPSWHRKYSCSAQTEDQIYLLSQAFDGIAKGKNCILPSLSLRVAVSTKNHKRDLPHSTGNVYPLRSLWQCTIHTFNTVIRALAASKLRVREMNIFNDRDMQNCSLSCDQLNMFDWTDASLVDSLTAVTTLSISLTDRVFAFDEDEEIDEDLSDCGSEDKEADRQPTQRDQEIMTESGQEGNFTGLASFIAACPRLSHFELHYLSIVWPKRRLLINFPRQDILRYVAELHNPPMLKRCRIRGASVREADLLNLIQRTKAVEISAEVIRLEEGTLRPVIDYCISKSAAVTKLHIDTVLEKSDQGYTGLVHFLDEGESRKYAGKFVVGTEILNREGDNRTKPVKYYVRRPIAEGNPAIYHWSALRRRGYGY
ncbi:uncharacterized protein G6M90_00g093770 [Metarhizium brunneum]|uniref:F-box domain-containing protein n=1 Tax=Metarhizium brunneum TaxID=500148 RepID=A0A7D5ZDQ2_9HYPO|nr:hypothetical protein G6M90_00g093770 [Metarhizium brunneum]